MNILLFYAILTIQSGKRESIDLKKTVEECSFIVKGKMEKHNKKNYYRIIEIWKGEYKQGLFYQITPPDEYLPAFTGIADLGQKVKLGDEVLIFYGPWNNIDGKFTNGSQLTLPIKSNTIIFNQGTKKDHYFHVQDFKKMIMEIINK